MKSAWEVPEGRPVRLPGRGTTYVREVAGPPDAPTVMLLHGLGGTGALNWPGAFAALSPWFRVVAIDHRGHGRGIHKRAPFRMRDCADDAIALADVLGIEQMIVAGYSMGGPITLLARRRHPDRVSGIVLCATSARFASDDADAPPPRPPLGVPLRLIPPALRRQISGIAVQSMLGDDAPAALLDEARRHDPAALMEAAQSLQRFDARPWAGKLECPAASVITEHDQLVPRARQVELAHLVNAVLFPIEADHLVAGRRPDRFLPVLVAACRSVQARVSLAGDADPRAPNA